MPQFWWGTCWEYYDLGSLPLFRNMFLTNKMGIISTCGRSLYCRFFKWLQNTRWTQGFNAMTLRGGRDCWTSMALIFGRCPRNGGTPKIMHSNRMFHYKPSSYWRYWCCRNVHQHLPGKLSLLELRTSTMWESYLNCFAPCNSARSLSYVFTTPVLIGSTVIVAMGEHHTGIHVHVRFHRLVESFPHATPVILAASIWFQTLRPGNVSQALISTKLAPHLSGEAC